MERRVVIVTRAECEADEGTSEIMVQYRSEEKPSCLFSFVRP
jgi:hypothetical protein